MIDPENSAEQSCSRNAAAAHFRDGPLAPYLAGSDVFEVGDASTLPAGASGSCVFAGYRLQFIRDYRAALQAWFGMLRIGGHLVVVVPHAFLRDRRQALPSPWSRRQLRLYTARSLLEEIEEALAPNSYRVRWAGDCDAGYDYRLDRSQPPVGQQEVAVAIERIRPPAWDLDEPGRGDPAGPDYAFEPRRTRFERTGAVRRDRILALKLDHLGDFVMGIPALKRLRAVFPDAEITLVVGSWNQAMASELGLSDHVVAFDAYPRNSGEEEPDARGRRGMFDALVIGEFDLALDLRTDPDTRIFLANVNAPIKAGLGTRAEFPHLDIFLPIDFTRFGREHAEVTTIPPDAFSCQPEGCTRSSFHIACRGERVGDHSAIVWGPYWRLVAGDYIFEPFCALDRGSDGVLRYDIGLDRQSILQGAIEDGAATRLHFRNDLPGAEFEFRFWADGERPVHDFHFFGGRLIRQGASSVLHQSEYLTLLVELVAMRVNGPGPLRDEAAGS